MRFKKAEISLAKDEQFDPVKDRLREAGLDDGSEILINIDEIEFIYPVADGVVELFMRRGDESHLHRASVHFIDEINY